jgi:hypothetical protein
MVVGGFERGKCSRKKSGGNAKLLLRGTLQKNGPGNEPETESRTKATAFAG